MFEETFLKLSMQWVCFLMMSQGSHKVLVYVSIKIIINYVI